MRLAGLARAPGANYSRYADDLLFSGGPEFARCAEGFAITVGAIALEEGFELNHRKTRVMRQGVSQRAAGMVLNSHANVPRTEFDRLKAILHNCAKFGPASQNRDSNPEFRSHLLGRIAHVLNINPTRGERLKAIFERVEWGRRTFVKRLSQTAMVGRRLPPSRSDIIYSYPSETTS